MITVMTLLVVGAILSPMQVLANKETKDHKNIKADVSKNSESSTEQHIN
jgi:hypothetical protein